MTYNDEFDGFPMFSPDGTKLVFASNRNAAKEGRHERVYRAVERLSGSGSSGSGFRVQVFMVSEREP